MRLFAGQSAWIVQRLTALALIVLLLVAAGTALARPAGYESWRALLSSAHGAVLVVLGFLALGLHGWVGGRDVVLDYVHAPALRLALLFVIAFLLVGVQVRVFLAVARGFAGAA